GLRPSRGQHDEHSEENQDPGGHREARSAPVVATPSPDTPRPERRSHAGYNQQLPRLGTSQESSAEPSHCLNVIWTTSCPSRPPSSKSRSATRKTRGAGWCPAGEQGLDQTAGGIKIPTCASVVRPGAGQPAPAPHARGSARAATNCDFPPTN